MRSKIKHKIIFISLNDSSFVLDDISYLSENNHLVVFHFKKGLKDNTVALILRWIKQLFWLILNIWNADIIYGWFADYHMLFPELLSKITGIPVVICLGGYDCSYVPEYKYGVFFSKWRSPIAKYILRNADVLFPVTSKLIYSRNEYTLWDGEREYGLKYNLPDLKTK